VAYATSFYFREDDLMPLIIILLLLFVVPWLAFVLLMFFLLFWLVFIPLGFAGRSIFWLFAGPAELLKVLVNNKVRQNHALQHATIHVLERDLGIPQVEGMAYEDGFTLKGLAEPGVVYQAALKGLEKLKRGERDFAIHPKCGTTILVVNTIASVIFIAVLFLTGNLTIISVLVALVLAHLTGPFGGRLVQRYITTNPVPDLEVTGVSVQPARKVSGIILIEGPGELYVHTRTGNDVIEPEIID